MKDRQIPQQNTDRSSPGWARESTLAGSRLLLTLGLRLGPLWATLDPTGPTGLASVGGNGREAGAAVGIKCEGRFGGPERYLKAQEPGGRLWTGFPDFHPH